MCIYEYTILKYIKTNISQYIELLPILFSIMSCKRVMLSVMVQGINDGGFLDSDSALWPPVSMGSESPETAIKPRKLERWIFSASTTGNGCFFNTLKIGNVIDFLVWMILNVSKFFPTWVVIYYIYSELGHFNWIWHSEQNMVHPGPIMHLNVLIVATLLPTICVLTTIGALSHKKQRTVTCSCQKSTHNIQLGSCAP